MAEYIEREAAVKRLLDIYEYEFPTASGAFDEFATRIVPSALKSIPASDVEPKREPAVWVRYSTTMMECSRCGRHTARHRYEYCPHCGAPIHERKEE